MSSLSNQLSALSSQSGFAHSAETTSAHVGLGFAHSSRHGRSLLNSDGVKRRPSVLYDNAREAADVPDGIVRENAAEALDALLRDVGDGSSSRTMSFEKLMDLRSLEFERGTATQARNAAVDESIDGLLRFLMTCVVECPPSSIGGAVTDTTNDMVDNPFLLRSLQIIEYLLRKYEIHSRDNIRLLPVFLQLISSYPGVVQRVLGLLNLQSVNGGMWTFLRPYAAKESPPLNRTVLAKGAARDEAVFGVVVVMGRDAVEVWKKEQGNHNNDDDGRDVRAGTTSVRRGISAVLSFTASIIVEALRIQSKMGPDKHGVASGVREGHVRMILPYIVRACESRDCGEWREWGRLLGSALSVSCSNLSCEVRGALGDAVVGGMPRGSTKMLLGDVTEEDWERHSMEDRDVDDASSAIMTLLSILGSSSSSSSSSNIASDHKSNDDEWKYYLPLHPSKRNVIDYLGCDLPSSTYKLLSNRKALFPSVVAGAMGSVLGSLCDEDSGDDDRIRSVGPLLGAIIMHAFGKIEKEASKGLRKKGRELGSDGDLLFLLSLIKESSLAPIWESKQAGLVTALAVQTITSYDKLCKYLVSSECGEQKQSMISHRYKMILEALAKIDSAACDKGIAYAIDSVTTKSRKGSDSVSKEDRMSNLSLILGNARSILDTTKNNVTETNSNADRAVDTVDGAAFLLPPRVALEHADATVRINAIAGLKVMDVASLESDLGSALLRRLSIDDDPTVVVSAGEVLIKMLENCLEGGESSDLCDDVKSLAKGVLSALFHWTFIGKDEYWSPSLLIDASSNAKSPRRKGNEPELPPLLICLRICGLVGRMILESNDMNDDDSNETTRLLYAMFLSLTAHVHAIENKGSFKKVSATASLAISQLSNSDDKSPTLKYLFTNHEMCFGAIQLGYGTDNDEAFEIPDLVHKRFLWLALHTFSSYTLTLTQSHQVVTLVLYQMRQYTKESRKSASFQAEVDRLVDLIQKCLTVMRIQEPEELHNALLQLVSVNTTVAFQSVAKPAIRAFVASLADDDYTGLIALIHGGMHPQAYPQIVSRLLALTDESFGARKSANGVADLLLPLLSLLSHSNREVRQKVMAVIEKFNCVDDGIISSICINVTDKQSPTWSSVVMDGVNALPQLFGYIVSSSKSPAQVQEYLLKGCLNCALTESGFSQYGCNVATILLSSMEKSGESIFPLSKRWDLTGKAIFEAFSAINDDEKEMGSELRNCVATMLKGIVVTNTQSDGQIISIGPSNSGRVRSYSIGTSDSFRLLEPYPKDMTRSILQALRSSSSELMTKSVIEFVLARQSWTTGVFPKLDSQSKQEILFALLKLRTDQDNESAGQVILNLPLKASDFIHLLRRLDVSASENEQLGMVFLADAIRGKLDALGKASDISKISSLLFEHLLSLSSTNSMELGDSGGKEYTRVSILQSLLALHSEYKNQLSDYSQKRASSGRKRSRSHSDVGHPSEITSEAKLLVGLVGGDVTSTEPLHSDRGKGLSLTLLSILCEESPSTVVTSLLPALSSLEGHAVGDALSAIVPAFCSHAQSAGLSLFDLLDTFVTKIVADIPGNKTLIDQFANALMTLSGNEAGESLASFITSVIALEGFNLQLPSTSDNDTSVNQRNPKSNILHVIAHANSVMKVSVALSLLQYAENLMSFICNTTSEVEGDKQRVMRLAIYGAGGVKSLTKSYMNCNKPQKRSILYLVTTLLHSVHEILSTPAARKLVRKSKGAEADLCLRLWQEMMQTNVNSLNFHSKQDHGALDIAEKKFWIAAPVVTNECLESLQNLLPVSHFLASVDSILTDDSVESFIKKKTIHMLTNRVAEVNHGSPEHSLFLEMVPDLVRQLETCPKLVEEEDISVASRKAIVKQQGALVAIESFVTSLYPSSENSRTTNAAAKVFLPALAKISDLLAKTSTSWLEAISTGVVSETHDAQCQLLSSSALCISSLISNLKARCLHLLPQIIKPLIKDLKSINTSNRKDQSSTTFLLAILRTISTIADILPGFLLPYLPLIFSGNALPAVSVQHELALVSESSLAAASNHLEVSLATKTPARQLIPCLTNALVMALSQKENGARCEEACVILRVMNIAIENSSRSELTSVVGKIFNGLVTAYDGKRDSHNNTDLLINANKCLLSLVMKLSETQLRPLYARLREWRGDIDGDESLSSRRYAFWSLSAELSKALKSIFFPCLTSVITDVVDELENAVSVLCSKKKGGEAKRRKTEDNLADIAQTKSLQPLLLCMESAFKADAHEGGNWTRGDDNQRYNVILNHLGKLILAQVPSNMTIISDLSPGEQKSVSGYEMLIQGVGTQEHGNVVGCLTALATAAGNEQLWKPLNFAVLEACAHRRSEVRKAGVSCLLSIIESIGEEYMVLLPECLPVLSELLEDADEDVVSMAKECVRQGEELLGESLEESLR